MQEKLLSKELSYEIIKQQLDLDHTIEQNYKDQQYVLHHEKIESVLEAKPEPPVSESVPSPKEEEKKNSEPSTTPSDQATMDPEECIFTTFCFLMNLVHKEQMIFQERELFLQQLEKDIEAITKVNQQLEAELATKTEEINALNTKFLKEQENQYYNENRMEVFLSWYTSLHRV